MDALYRPNDTDTFRVQMLASDTEFEGQLAVDLGQPAESFSGNALSFNYNHNERNWLVRADYRDFTDDFRADLGFVTRVDFKVAILGGEYRWFGEDQHWYSRITVGGDWDETTQQDGTLIERENRSLGLGRGSQAVIHFSRGWFPGSAIQRR